MILPRLILTFLVTTTSFTWSPQETTRQGQDYALFFANDNYQNNPDFGNLKNPVTDATAIAQELQEMYGFTTQVYKNYSRSQVYSVLEKWQKRSFGKDDQLFLFFSGHGTFWEFTKKGYFVPNTPSTDFDAYIELTDLGNIVTQIPCRHILLAVDACYSGTIDQAIAFKNDKFKRPGETKTTKRKNLIDRLLRNQSRLLITSGGKERTPDGEKHSPFADALLIKLRATYSSGDGLCTYQDLLSQLERVSPTPHQGELPEHEQGGFVFVATEIDPPEQDHMVFIKGGTFQMGSKEGQSDEEPLHHVTLNNYYLGRYEVTVAEFYEFMQATSYKTDAEKNGGSYFWRDDGWKTVLGTDWQYNVLGEKRPSSEYNHPVIHVSWNDVINYCNWRTKQEGLQPVYTINESIVTANWKANGYRLPTEAEWEFAARNRGKEGGTSTDYQLSIYANVLGNGDGYEYTAPVGTFEANTLGLFDMSGNVWEWCWDWYSYYSKGASVNPRGPMRGTKRVLRGGSWDGELTDQRSTYRFYNTPEHRLLNIGFRLSRSGR